MHKIGALLVKVDQRVDYLSCFLFYQVLVGNELHDLYYSC